MAELNLNFRPVFSMALIRASRCSQRGTPTRGPKSRQSYQMAALSICLEFCLARCSAFLRFRGRSFSLEEQFWLLRRLAAT